MVHRFASITGLATTIAVGATLGLLAFSAFGPSATLAVFLAIALTASAVQRAVARQRRPSA